jgi:uncharacterized membrane protein YgdD (TMEM256/DUF423 family)
MSERLFAVAGALLAFAAVAAGAFGAHALKARLTPEQLAVFDTGVRYHLAHALALFAAAWVCTRWPGTSATAGGWLFIAGIVLFSGSLYALALTGQRVFGAVTPVGGLCFLAGWLALALAVVRGGPDG